MDRGAFSVAAKHSRDNSARNIFKMSCMVKLITFSHYHT